MRTREKVIALLVGATLVLGALISFIFLDNEVEANYFRWLFANKLTYGLSSPLRFLADELPAGTLFYGGLTIFALVMTLVVLKMIRDGEIQTLRSILMDLRSEKHATEHLLQEHVWKGKHEQHAKDLAMRNLESSIEKIETLLQDLNKKELELKARDAELMALKSSVAVEYAAGSNSPAERALREEIKKKNEILQGKDAAVRDLEQRLNAQGRLWENRLQEKNGTLKERENELESSRAKIIDLNSRLQQLESAKKRAEGLLQGEMRQKKEVLEAEAIAIKAEEKRLGEKIRNLESQLAERDKALRHRELEMSGFRRQVKELEAARSQADRRVQEVLAAAEKDHHEKDRLVREIEQRLGANLQTLQNEISEKQLLLQVRDDEVSSLKSEIKGLSLRLSEMAAAKVRAEEVLQEDLKKVRQQHDAEKVAYEELVSRADAEMKLMSGQLAEREALLRRRDDEIQALEQKVHAVSQGLRAANEGKEQVERSLREELKKEQLQRTSSEAAKRELEQRYDREVQSFKGLLSEEQESRKSRDEEIKSLKSQVASLAEQLANAGSAKERAASLLQQTLRKEKEVLQASDSAVREIEQNFKAKIAALEEQLQAKQELVGSRDSEAAALRSELLSLNQRMTDLATAKDRAESLFEEAVNERTALLQSKDAGLRKLEEELTGKIWELEGRLREREESLHSRDSELTALKGRLDELTAAKEQAAHALREELRQKADLLSEKEAALSALEERFGGRIHSLESELSEKQELLEAREAELRTLLSQVNDQAMRLSELENANNHAARLFENELRRSTDLVQSKDGAMKALEDRLTERLGSLESQLGLKQDLLETRDAELDALMSKVNELTHKLSVTEVERERAERLAQEELREKAALLQSKEASITELEERFGGRVDSLERQIAEKHKLLEAKGAELHELRAQMNTMAERLNEAESAKVNLEGLLQQERSEADKALVVTGTVENQAGDRINGGANGLDTLLNEREQLLQARDKLIHNLMTELKEKKTQLAKQEIEVWKNIERREAWKHRLSKIGIRLKD
jgi:chromosome segregation ATPase